MNLALPFSYSGRIPRKDYWIGFVIALVVLGLVAAAFVPYFSTTSGTNSDRILVLAAAAFFLWVHSAVTVKRLHDLNRPAWHYIFYGVVPLFLMIMVIYPTLSFIGFALWGWTKYHLGFMRGTEGPNNYGPDPLAPSEPNTFEPG